MNRESLRKGQIVAVSGIPGQACSVFFQLTIHKCFLHFSEVLPRSVSSLGDYLPSSPLPKTFFVAVALPGLNFILFFLHFILFVYFQFLLLFHPQRPGLRRFSTLTVDVSSPQTGKLMTGRTVSFKFWSLHRTWVPASMSKKKLQRKQWHWEALLGRSCLQLLVPKLDAVDVLHSV